MPMRFAAGLLVLFALPALTGGKIEAGGLLARMRAAAPNLWSSRITGELAAPAGGATLQTEASGYRYLVRQCVGALCNGTYFDGERLFALTINDTPVASSPELRADLRTLNGIRTLQFLNPSFDGTVQVRSADAAQAMLEVDIPGGSPALVTVDRVRAVPVGFTDEATGTQYTFSAYRKVDGVLLPFALDRDGTPLERYVRRAVDRAPLTAPHGIALNIPVDAQPLPLVTAGLLPIGECRIGTIAVRCLLDTGNTGMAMSLELADALDIHSVAPLPVEALTRYATTVVHAGPLQIGGVTVGPADYAVLAGIHELGYDVVIGADLFARTSVRIDEKTKTVTFGAAPPGGATIPIRFDDLVPQIDAGIDGIPAALAVDTGDQAAVNLAPAFFDAHPALLHDAQQIDVAGSGAKSAALAGELESLRFGGLRFTDVPAVETPLLTSPPDGHIGSGLLWRYAVYLDYKTFTMILESP